MKYVASMCGQANFAIGLLGYITKYSKELEKANEIMSFKQLVLNAGYLDVLAGIAYNCYILSILKALRNCLRLFIKYFILEYLVMCCMLYIKWLLITVAIASLIVLRISKQNIGELKASKAFQLTPNITYYI